MTSIALTIKNIEKAADAHGIGALAREAGVPYTTVKSFSDRNWSHKNLDMLDKLANAAVRLSADTGDAA
jgi:nucleoside phosphorylase